jgi:DNA-binding MarR family transcriptional regulator
VSSEDVARLYLAVGRLNRALRRDAPDAAVGHGALSVLATLLHSGPLRLGTLAEIEGVSAPAMTRIVTSLEDLGHVRRTPDPADRRAHLVAVTASGDELVSQGRSQRLRALEARLARLSAADRRRLLEAVAALEALSEDPPPPR